MTDLSRRSLEAELMDDPAVTFEAMDRCLRELTTINRLALAYRPTLAWLDRLAAAPGRGAAPLSILDVGCGQGDMLRRIRRWAGARGVPVSLTGLDISPEVIRAAEAATPPALGIRYVVGDLFGVPADQGWDVILSAQFAHHLPPDALVRFIAWMDDHARRSWMISDLHRHPIPYHFIRIAFRLAGFGPLVVHDGPVSIARGFVRADWVEAVARAGVDPARVEIAWCLPFRWRVGCLTAPP